MIMHCPHVFFFFFFNDTATTEIYTLSLHDALPICGTPPKPLRTVDHCTAAWPPGRVREIRLATDVERLLRSEEHTSELQSLAYLVCRLLLEKKKNIQIQNITS